MKTASPEVRAIAIKACASGIPRRQVADIVGYHLNSINRWIHEFEREKRITALPRGHRHSLFSEEERQKLAELLDKNVDMTLEEIRSYFTKECSLNAIHKLVKSLGVASKKNSGGKRARSRRWRSQAGPDD
ncbi:MAG: helix-turn-helix domain-containing protein [Deltaproteobacteria bacterium]|jgi:transposase|nr:helix-turn-helix domain-containing protein [Deltaproteobacteria bacterium]